jgi:regulator of protease activity HflC (stomatin/prohibitin superfamily)
MARSQNTEDGDFLTALPARNHLKRLAILIGVSTILLLILVVGLWKTFFKYVPPGKMLVVISKNGDVLDSDEVLAKQGQKGILREVRGEGWHFILPILYTTELKNNQEIGPGKVGIVTAQGGLLPKEGRVLAEEGERGIQRMILLPGSYRLNPYGYKVKEVPMVKISPGFVGVLRRKLASTDGEMGIIKDRILQPGLYPLNTEEYEVIACDVGIYQTTYQYLKESNDNTAIKFPAKDGNTIELDCTIEWEVKPEFWPVWVAKFGTDNRPVQADMIGEAVPSKVGNLKNIERVVIDQHVRKICRDRGFNYGAQDFLEGDKREKFQADFRTELDKVCNEDNVVVRSAFIRNIIIPDKFLEQKRLERLAVENRLTSEALTLTAETEAEVAEAKQTIKLKEAKVKSETERMVATVERETQNIQEVTDAEIERLKDEYSAKIAIVEASRKKALREAEAEAKKLKDTAESSIYKMRMDLFGKDSDAFLRYTLAKELNPNMRLRLFQSGPGTLWTNMGDKSMNLFMPMPSAEKKDREKNSSEANKSDK